MTYINNNNEISIKNFKKIDKMILNKMNIKIYLKIDDYISNFLKNNEKIKISFVSYFNEEKIF